MKFVIPILIQDHNKAWVDCDRALLRVSTLVVTARSSWFESFRGRFFPKIKLFICQESYKSD